MKKLIHEIHRRSLWQVLGIYLVTGWIVLGAVGTLAESLNLPDWTPRFAFFLLIIGLPIVLATAFVQQGVGRSEATEEQIAEDTSESEPEIQGAHHRLLTWRNAMLGGVLGFSLLFGFAGLYVVIQDRGRSFAPQEAVAEEADPGIAFLPFEVSGTQRANLREGMVTLLDTSLDGVAGVRAIDDRTVLAQWEQRVAPGTRADLATSLEVAAATSARYALVGSVVDLGDQIRMSGEIYEVPSGASLGRVQAEGSPDSLAAIIEDLAIETLRTLGRSGAGGVPPVDLAGVTTHSLEALEAYLDGEAQFRTGDFSRAQPYFEQALKVDSAFALAHYRMSQVIGWSQGAGADEVRSHLEAAQTGNLPPRMALLARAGQFESLEPLAELEVVVQQHPEDAEAWFILGDLLFHAGLTEVDGALERANLAFARAVELDPNFAPYLIHLIDFAFADYDRDKAAEMVAAYSAASPGSAADRTHQIMHKLVFEPPPDSAEFEAAVDTLAELGAGIRYYILTGQPRTSRVGEAVSLRDGGNDGGPSFLLCWRYSLAEGHWDDFIAYATDPELEPTLRLACLAQASFRDFPVPDSLIQTAIADVANDSGAFPILLAGAYAASQGRWDEYDSWLAALEEELKKATDASDSTNMRDLTVFRSMMVGLGAYERGEMQAAFDAFESVPNGYLGPLQRWWRGRINLELGRPEAAARYFQSFFVFSHPWTRSLFYLGQAYEQMGDLEKAQEAYAEYLDIYKDADKELLPVKQQARDALIRLGPLDQ